MFAEMKRHEIPAPRLAKPGGPIRYDRVYDEALPKGFERISSSVAFLPLKGGRFLSIQARERKVLLKRLAGAESVIWIGHGARRACYDRTQISDNGHETEIRLVGGETLIRAPATAGQANPQQISGIAIDHVRQRVLLARGWSLQSFRLSDKSDRQPRVIATDKDLLGEVLAMCADANGGFVVATPHRTLYLEPATDGLSFNLLTSTSHDNWEFQSVQTFLSIGKGRFAGVVPGKGFRVFNRNTLAETLVTREQRKVEALGADHILCQRPKKADEVDHVWEILAGDQIDAPLTIGGGLASALDPTVVYTLDVTGHLAGMHVTPKNCEALWGVDLPDRDPVDLIVLDGILVIAYRDYLLTIGEH